jgi:hypothetical protein
MVIRSIANDADATTYKTMYESSSGSADAKIVRVLRRFLVGNFKSYFLVVCLVSCRSHVVVVGLFIAFAWDCSVFCVGFV